jgi:hypothetical protein
MRVVVRSEAFEARPDRAVHLVELLLLASRRRHDVLVHPEAAERWQDWLRAMETTQAILATACRRAVQDSEGSQAIAPSTWEVHVGDPDESDWEQESPRLHLFDALELLNMSLEILVEDETSDGAFLDAVVPPPLEAAWRQARHGRRVTFVTLGGVTQVPRRLAGERVLPPLCKRSFVLIDSDAPQPWTTPGRAREACWDALPRDSKKAAKTARSVRLPVEVLERRMAENYLPPSALKVWVSKLPPGEQENKRLHVEAFGTLPDQCQQHHHLKDGLKPAEREYYGDLSEDVEQALSFPLGRNTWRAFQHVKASELHAHGVHAELAPLFQQLLRLV